MSNNNKPQGLTATQKISLVAGTLPVLYLLPSNANAAIVHNTTPINLDVFTSPITEWDVDGDGNSDFLFSVSTDSYIDIESVGGRLGRGFVQLTGANQPEVENLSSGFVVGPTLAAGYQFSPYDLARTILTTTTTSVFGVENGFSNGSQFLGFRFETGTGDTLYGWAEFTINAGEGVGTVVVNQWAYNDTPDGSIEVGQTEDDAPSTPEPSSGLALLAMGAAGVYRWRKNRKA